MSPDSTIVEVFTSYQAYLAASSIVAVMTGLKRALGGVQHPAVKLVMTIGNLVLGAAIGLIPGFLPGASTIETVMVGLVVGFWSESLYAIAKRTVPSLVGADPAGSFLAPHDKASGKKPR